MSCKRRPPFFCCLRCKQAKYVVKNEEPATKASIMVFSLLAFLFCAAQSAAHMIKWFNIQDFNDVETVQEETVGVVYDALLVSEDANRYDTGCWSGQYTNQALADALKLSLCNGGQDTDCLNEGSNWTFIFLFNGCMYGALGLNFLFMAIGAYNYCMRWFSGFLFCITGYAYVYSLY